MFHMKHNYKLYNDTLSHYKLFSLTKKNTLTFYMTKTTFQSQIHFNCFIQEQEKQQKVFY